MPPRAATACAISAVEMFTPIPPCMIGTKLLPLSSRRKSSSRRSSRLFIYDVLFVLACKGTPVHRVPNICRGTLSSPSPHSPCKPLGTTVPIIPSPSKRLQHNHVKTARHEGLSKQPTLEASSACIPSENDRQRARNRMDFGPVGLWMQMRQSAHASSMIIVPSAQSASRNLAAEDFLRQVVPAVGVARIPSGRQRRPLRC